MPVKAGFEARHDEQKYQSRNFRHPTIADQVVKESLSPIVGNGSWLPHNSSQMVYPPIATGGENTVGPLTSDSRALSAV
jgi:hypothetical protein